MQNLLRWGRFLAASVLSVVLQPAAAQGPCQLPPPVLSSNAPVCEGEPLGFFAAGVPTGASYQWTGPNGFSSTNANPGIRNPTPAASGFYHLTVTLNGCTGTDSLLVTVNPSPVVTISPAGPIDICQGDSVVLTASGADHYQWITGDTTASITVYGTGNFRVTGTTSAGCSANAPTVIVRASPAPTVSISAGGSTSFCQGGSVTLTAVAPPNAALRWSNGATTPVITVTQAGTYTVTATNAANCSTTSAPVLVTVDAPPTVTITAGGPISFCQGGAVTLTASGAASYRWSNGATAPSITVTTAGTYTVTGTSAAGCTATSTPVVVTVDLAPAAPTATGTERCGAGSVTLTANGAPAGGTYRWYNQANGGTLLATGDIFVTPTLTNLTVYYVSAVSTAGCESPRVNVRVLIKNLPQVQISSAGPTTFCQGGSVRLTAVGAASYLWSNGATTGSIVVTQPGTYSVVGTNANGCSATSNAITVTTTAPPNVTLTAGGPTTFCQGGSVTLTANGAASYFWSTGATSPSITVTQSGNYLVTGTSTTGCVATSSPIAVTVNQGPAVAITASGPTTICQGSTVTLTAAADPGSTIRWSNGATTPSISVTQTGSFTVTATNPTTGCTTTTPATAVTVTTPPTVTIAANGPTTFCQGDSVTLTAGGATNYSWNTGATTASITVATGGTYTVTGETNGCASAPATITLTTQTAPLAPAAQGEARCGDGPVTLNASGTPTGGTYHWYSQLAGGSILASGPGFTTPTLTATTTYYVASISAGGCEGPRTAVVATINPAPSVSVTASGSTSFCQGDSVMLTAAAPAGSSLLWSTGATTASIWVMTSGTYTATATNGACTTTSAPISVTVVPVPSAAFAYSTSTYCLSGAAPTPIITGVAGGIFSASPAGLTIDPATGTIQVGTSQAGTYAVTYTMAGNCPASYTVPVTLTSSPTAGFTYGASTYCAGSTAAIQPQFTAGASAGIFTATPAGLVIDPATGAIAAATSQPGTYVVTNTIPASGACASVTATANLSIEAAPIAAVISNGPTTFCQGGSVTLTASGGNAYLWSNGATTASIVVTTSDSYQVEVTNAAGCSTTSAPVTVTVNPSVSAAFTYASASYCLTAGSNPLPTLTGTSGGSFTAVPAGLSLNATTGEINLTGSAAGTYVITYAVPGPCPASQTDTVSLSAPARAVFAYPSARYCAAGTVIAAVLSAGSTAGIFSASPGGLSLNTTTGAIDPSNSQPGTYTITNTVAGSGTCADVNATTTVTIDAVPAQPGITQINSGGNITLTSSATSGNQWFFNNNLIPGANNQTYQVPNGQSGSYSVTTSSAAGCTSAPSAPVNVTITGLAELNPTAVSLEIYPNPVNGSEVFVKLHDYSGIAGVMVFDALGRTVMEREFVATTDAGTLDVTALPTGVYSVRVQAGPATITRRLLRQ